MALADRVSRVHEMDELTEAERKALHHAMKRLGWRPVGEPELGREFERRLYQIIMPSYNEGAKEAFNFALGDIYRARFGDIPDALRVAIAAIEDAHEEDTLRRWVTLFGTGTAEDIAAALLGVSDTMSTTG